MGKPYYSQGSCSVNTGVTAVSVIAVTTTRPRIYQIDIGSPAVPGDSSVEWAAIRFTADGTGTSVTPTAIDSGDPSASLCSSKKTYTVEPTYTSGAILWDQPVNQRASFRFVAVPGRELTSPATASNGIGIRSVQASTTSVNWNASIAWIE